MKYSIVVAATASEAAPLQYIAPFTGTSIFSLFFLYHRCAFFILFDLSLWVWRCLGVSLEMVYSTFSSMEMVYSTFLLMKW